MGVMSRVAVILIGAACVVLAIYNAVTPDRNTVSLFGVQSDGAHARLVVSVPSPGPIGVRSGDELDVRATTLHDRIAYFGAAETGSTIAVPLIRNGRHVTVALVVPPGNTTPPRAIDLILVLLEVAFGIAVMIRVGNVPLARMVVWLAVVEQIGTVAYDFIYTAPTADLGFWSGSATATLYEGGTSFVALWATTFLPGVRLKRTPLLVAALVVLSLVATANGTPLLALVVPYPLFPTIWIHAITIASIVVGLGLGIALVTLAQAAPAERRMRSMWFVSTLIGWFVGGCLEATGSPWLFWVAYLLQSFTLLGPIYAVLRHRMLDLNFVITRSAIYAALSLSMLGSFAGGEWLFGRLADALLQGGFWKGIAAQLLSFALAIVIGVYLTSVHKRLEDWVNGVLFRERIRKLKLLESFAHEADLLQTRSELLAVTYEALKESIEADDIAVYVEADGALVRAHGSGAADPRLERDDRVVLQLLERHRPFVSEVRSLSHWLIVPLAVRREIVGAIACGPKRDHTEYLPDELRTLNDVAQHVATAYALLFAASVATLGREHLPIDASAAH
ncbi:MAG TPA: GAF domain-containing protein [Candidatus Acidoferrales bacterium]|nr:GAF domain-containing protein [Candidatus Acidoferrales bacterium]